MVFNPARVATGYLRGREIGEQRKIRGLDQARIKKEEDAKAKAAAQATRIEGLTSAYATGDTTAEQRLLQEGPAGLAGAQSVRDYQLGQQTEQRETQAFDRDTANRELEQNLPRALTITDQAEWDQFEAWARPRSLAAGVDPAMYDQIASMPMEQAQGFLRQQMEGKPEAAPSGGIKNVQMPDGTQKSFDIINPQQRQEYQAAIEAGGQDAPTRAIQGTPEDFSSNKIADEMAQAESATTNFIADIYEAQDFVKQNPAALTDASGLARIASNVGTNVDVLMSGFDVEFENEAVQDAVTYTSSLTELGIDNVEMQSIMIGLATQQAVINNPGGRISDRDVKDAMKQIGASIQNAEGFIRVSDRLAKRADRIFRNQYKSRSKEKTSFDGDLGLKVGGKDFSNMTIKELNKINPDSLTPEEKAAAADAWDRLNASN